MHKKKGVAVILILISYTTVRTWSNLASSSSYLDFSGSHYVATGYTYRLAFTAAVYRNGSSETMLSIPRPTEAKDNQKPRKVLQGSPSAVFIMIIFFTPVC